MNVRQFALPDLGEGLADAEIVRWLVSVGDAVEVDQPVVEVETAKAASEVPVPYAGVVTALHGEAGATVDVGAPLLSVACEGFSEPGVETSPNLVGSGPSTRARRKGGRRRNPVVPSAGVPAPETVRNGHSRVAVVSPVVRKLARDNDVDLRSVTGSGPEGLVC